MSPRAPGARRGQARHGRPLGQAEVRDLRLSAPVEDDVRALDVAMDDAVRVCGLQGIRNLDRKVDHSRNRQGLFRDVLPSCGAFDVLHRNEVMAVGLRDFVDDADVGVVQAGCGAGLTLEAV